MFLISSYFDGLASGIEYLIALGSIIGVLGFVFSLILFIIGSDRHRKELLLIMIACIVLMAACGIQTGINYFHLNI